MPFTEVHMSNVNHYFYWFKEHKTIHPFRRRSCVKTAATGKSNAILVKRISNYFLQRYDSYCLPTRTGSHLMHNFSKYGMSS